MSITKRTDWKKCVPITTPIPLNFRMNFTDHEFELIKEGFKPREMEDKWFIFFEDNWLYMHRSWTGHGIFKIKITKEPNETSYSVKETWVEHDPEFFNYKDENIKTDLLRTLIDSLIAT